MFANILKLSGIINYSIDDYKKYEPKDVTKIRKNFKVVIIDDENDLKNECLALSNVGFNVHFMNDIETIDSVSAYDIIFCDIKGVGEKLNKTLGGAFVIDEIRKQYSDKILIGFTAQMHDANLNSYFYKCDKMLNKDALRVNFSELIDSFIHKMHDPHWNWYRNRRRLIDIDFPTNKIAQIEDKYVRSLKKRTNLFKPDYILSYGEPIQNIIYNLMASFIFRAMVGN